MPLCRGYYFAVSLVYDAVFIRQFITTVPVKVENSLSGIIKFGRQECACFKILLIIVKLATLAMGGSMSCIADYVHNNTNGVARLNNLPG